jgi:cell division protein ZapA (FtsZ GTPase activity inhibitor)
MKTLKILLLGILLLGIQSCRTADEEIINPPVEQALQPNSTISNLMSRTALNDGSSDNIIDQANCLSVQLPVTVTVNGTVLTINDPSQLQDIEDIFDLLDDDVDTIVISFPITVILTDFSTVTVNSNTELLALAAQCNGENQPDDDIECIDFNYPITASVFDQNNDIIDTITINNDSEMYIFIENLADYAAVTINFPITVTLADGTSLVIQDIQELENAIDAAENICDEDDDNDYNDDDCNNCTTDSLLNFLTECQTWTVDKLERNDMDLEDQYVGYNFSFGMDGSVSVSQGSNTFNGTWQSSGTANNIEFTLNITGLNDFNDVWFLHELEQEPGEFKADFRKGDDRLRFESNCGSTGGDNLSETLTTSNSVWFISSYLDDGIDETATFNGFTFEFGNSGTVEAQNGSTMVNGSWSSIGNGMELSLNFGSTVPLDELNDEWDVISITTNQIELQDVSGGGGGTDTLILTKQ